MGAESGCSASKLTADVLVIGGGGAGLAGAVAAAERKCGTVIVLEKRATVGGNSATGGGPFAVGSPVQRRQGIETSADDYFETAMEWSNWRTNPRIVRAFIAKSGDTIRWLEDKGLEFLPITGRPTYHVPAGQGRLMMALLRRCCEDLGVRILPRTRATRLTTSRGGAVTGAIAEQKDKTLVIEARAVIVATGGYGSNPELLKKYCRSYRDGMEYHGVPNNGDGFLMAIDIGADVENLGTMLLEGPVVPTSIRLPIRKNEHESLRVPLVSFAWEPYLLWVNKEGRRFVTEETRAFHGGNAIARQPGNLCFIMFDDAVRRSIETRGFLRGRPLKDISPEEQRGPLPGLRQALESEATKGRLKIAHELVEIANWIGADCSTIEETVMSYNYYCDHNYDPEFCKSRHNLIPVREAPFYCIKCTSAFLDTIGGIKINERMEVIDTKNGVIPGLFAAGVVTGGWEAETYCFPLLGSARGFALNSGRIAGENAAAYVSTVGLG